MPSATPSRRSRRPRECPSAPRSATRTAGELDCPSASSTTRHDPRCGPLRARGDRVAHPAPPAVPARRRDPRARAGQARRRAARDPRGRLVVSRPLSRAARDARRAHDRGDRPGRGGRRARRRGERGQAPVLRRDRRLPFQARRRAGRRADARMRVRARARADRKGPGACERRRRARGRGDADGVRLRMIGATKAGLDVSITGLGWAAPERVVTNDELSQWVDTSDEWILERTGIRERRFADDDIALSDLALPACRDALAHAGVDGADIDLLIVATVTPDMMFPSTAALIADRIGARAAAAYDLSAGCTGFVYALAQAYGMLAGGLAQRALVVGGDLLSRIVDFSDRATLVLFGDGAGAVVLEAVEHQGFLAFELGADGGGGGTLWLPGSGSRRSEDQSRFIRMNGREVFKFATRVLVQSANDVLDRCGLTIADVDVYVPHQANVRIIDHATKKLGVPSEKVVVNVDRYGNTSSGSIPLALADAA